MAILIVTRLRQFAHWTEAFSILVDGHRAAKIRNNQSIEIQIDPGPHRVEAALYYWLRSGSVEINAEEDGSYSLKVGTNVVITRLLHALLRCTFRRRQYLYLVDESAPTPVTPWLTIKGLMIAVVFVAVALTLEARKNTRYRLAVQHWHEEYRDRLLLEAERAEFDGTPAVAKAQRDSAQKEDEEARRYGRAARTPLLPVPSGPE